MYTGHSTETPFKNTSSISIAINLFCAVFSLTRAGIIAITPTGVVLDSLVILENDVSYKISESCFDNIEIELFYQVKIAIFVNPTCLWLFAGPIRSRNVGLLKKTYIDPKK